MIEIINQQRKHKINRNKFETLLKSLVEHYKLNNPELSLVFTNTKTIQSLNHRFLKKNAPTDVLSFPIGEKSIDGKYYLGDIIISVPQALEQSVAQNHSLDKELELLVIHGFLHLLGFEHGGSIEKEEERIKAILIKRD